MLVLPSNNEYLRTALRKHQQPHNPFSDFPGAFLIETFENEQPVSNKQPAKQRQFQEPLTDEQVESAKQDAVPEKTRKDTEYCMRLFNSWCESRIESTGILIPSLTEMNEGELSK